MSLASSATFRPVKTRIRRTGTRRSSSKSYHPYHRQGELLLLTLLGLAGIAWLALPIAFLIKLLGSIALFLILPANLLREYWPKIKLHDLGWRMPNEPRHPIWYTAVVTCVAFLPIAFFLLVDDPIRYAAVNPSADWIPWIMTQGLVALLVMAQSAFFTGIFLFRLSHLVRPATAILLVGIILTLGQILLPGTLAIFALPLSFAYAWMAWQTHSFVPVAVSQILLSLTYDVLVRLSVS